jgi:hypothetical protein
MPVLPMMGTTHCSEDKPLDNKFIAKFDPVTAASCEMAARIDPFILRHREIMLAKGMMEIFIRGPRCNSFAKVAGI